jgi:thiamine-monophosphate kinase
MTFTRLGGGKEFDAIRDLIARFNESGSGIGDDAAAFEVPRGDQVVVSVDASVENRHFRPDWLTPEEIGYRAVTAALSDLAAMAAQPIAVLWAVNLPKRWRQYLPALADGALEAAKAADAKIVGGNLTASEELCITTTVIGSAFAPLRRDGAKQGDKVYVTGTLGAPAMALAALSANQVPDPRYKGRFAKPTVRIREGRWLLDNGATSGLDISDGLVGDAAHLAAASGVGLTIHIDRIPAVDGADGATAARSGEEYELLVTAPALDVSEFAAKFGIPLTEIGEVGGSDIAFLDRGRPVQPGSGHDHFSK